MDRFPKLLYTLLFGLLLISCGGGGGSSSSNGDSTSGLIVDPITEFTPTLDISPGGIWESQNLAGEPASKLYIDETGKVILVQSSISGGFDVGTGLFTPSVGYLRFGAGQIQLSTAAGVTGTYSESEVVLGASRSSPNISSCVITGSIIERASLNASLSCTREFAIRPVQMINFIPTPECEAPICLSGEYYDIPSSLEQIAGDYSFNIPLSLPNISISPTGVVSGSYSFGTECEVDGQVSVIDENYNLYDFEWTFSNCDEPLAGQDGRRFEGFLALQGNGVSVPGSEFLMSSQYLGIIMAADDALLPDFITGRLVETL